MTKRTTMPNIHNIGGPGQPSLVFLKDLKDHKPVYRHEKDFSGTVTSFMYLHTENWGNVTVNAVYRNRQGVVAVVRDAGHGDIGSAGKRVYVVRVLKSDKHITAPHFAHWCLCIAREFGARRIRVDGSGLDIATLINNEQSTLSRPVCMVQSVCLDAGPSHPLMRVRYTDNMTQCFLSAGMALWEHRFMIKRRTYIEYKAVIREQIKGFSVVGLSTDTPVRLRYKTKTGEDADVPLFWKAVFLSFYRHLEPST